MGSFQFYEILLEQFYMILLDILKILMVFLQWENRRWIQVTFKLVVSGGEGWTDFRWLQKMVGCVFMNWFYVFTIKCFIMILQTVSC